MAQFTYTGDESRYYPAQGVAVSPGESADFDVIPDDGRWLPSDPNAAPAVAPAPEVSNA